MRPRLSIVGRVLLLLSANLLLLVFLLLGSAGWGSLLSDSAKLRLTGIGEQITVELSRTVSSQWPEVLTRFSAAYGVEFSTSGIKPPPGGAPGFDDRPRPPRGVAPDFDRPHGPPPDADGTALSRDRPAPPPHLPGDARIDLQPASWLGPYRMILPGAISTTRGSQPLDVIVTASSLTQLLRFLGVSEWLGLGALAVVLSALLWAPFIVGMLRTIVSMKAATQRIAEGQFAVRVAGQRSDELGELASSINEMATRLERYVQGQKQFLADVAHETISPLARIQLGLGLLESRIDAGARAQLQDVQEDARQMADLLNELLLFSRAGMTSVQSTPQVIDLRALALKAAEREDADAITLEIDPTLRVRGHEALLLRALANLVRNALGYAGGSAIDIIAWREADQVLLSVRDHGPGVPETALARLGEPFFRADASRDRDSGGYGLGLAIVRKCVEASEGSVRFRNRAEGGFEAELSLRAA